MIVHDNTTRQTGNHLPVCYNGAYYGTFCLSCVVRGVYPHPARSLPINDTVR